jgi:hypothetical protein
VLQARDSVAKTKGVNRETLRGVGREGEKARERSCDEEEESQQKGKKGSESEKTHLLSLLEALFDLEHFAFLLLTHQKGIENQHIQTLLFLPHLRA